MKDWIVSLVVKSQLVSYIAPFGEMTSFHIDATKKKITLCLELLGEQSPVEAEADYVLVENGGKLSLVITNVKTSREWLTAVANEALKKFPDGFQVPSGATELFVKLARL